MKQYIKFLPVLIVVVVVFYSFYSLMPRTIPEVSGTSTEFSSKNVAANIKEISKKAHYLGSEESKRVREYIVSELKKLGLDVTVQEQVAFNYRRAGAKAYNIISRIKGTSKGKALLLCAHYDSDTNQSKGACDDGIGVFTIVEGVRAYLTSGKQAKNDIIILFTDGEEIGLMGANAFTKMHPWAKNIGLVLNFEARGSGGPSYLQIETKGGNGNFIKHFKRANTPYPLGTSLSYDISKTLPNYTDLRAFNNNLNVSGFNFGSAGDHFDYHTSQDSHERLDIETIEHQGSYIMPLLTYFANADLNNLESNDEYVFFSSSIFGVIYYPYSWIIPTLIISFLLFIGLLIYGVSRKKINIKEVLLGFIPFTATLILSGLITKFGWELLKWIYPQYQDIQQGFTYNGYTYIIAFSALSLAICFVVYQRVLNSLKTVNLIIAPIFMSLIINVIVPFTFKGGAYLILCVLTGMAILSILLFTKLSDNKKRLSIAIIVIPMLIIIIPNVQSLPVGLGLKFLFGSSLIIALIFGLLIPILKQHCKLLISSLLFGTAFITFIVASFQSTYSTDRRKPNGVNYVLDTDNNKAFWGSFDYSTDEYTRQFLGESPIVNKKKWGYRLRKTAEVKPITEPRIELNRDTVINAVRNIEFNIVTLRNAKRLELYANSNLTIKRLVINGIEIEKSKGNNYVVDTRNYRYIFDYNFNHQDSVINISLSIPEGQLPKFTLYESSYDLLQNPNFNIKPRADYMMPNSYPGNIDCIILKKSFDLSAGESVKQNNHSQLTKLK